MPPSSFKDYIEQVRTASDIVELVGETVELRRAGRKHVGLCPFHQEKAPSFQVDPDRGVFHCFGCKAGGSVFDFVMQLHGLEFSEAAFLLGDRLGIQRPQWRDGGDGKREQDRRRKGFGALEAAGEFFHETLFGPGGKEALAYLERRGMPEDVARRFGLGLAPDGWRGLLTHLTSRGFDVDCLVEAGLVSRSEESQGVYDRFRNRVTFAIRDTAGRIVSFGEIGRAHV
jgi:DNA primase